MALERDVTLATLYGTPAILILRHQTSVQTAEVHVHTLSGPGMAPVKTHVLRLQATGRFAINVVDNLIIVHHQATRSSQIFDTSLPGETDGSVAYHSSVAPPKCIRPASLDLPGLVEPQKHNCELCILFFLMLRSPMRISSLHIHTHQIILHSHFLIRDALEINKIKNEEIRNKNE